MPPNHPWAFNNLHRNNGSHSSKRHVSRAKTSCGMQFVTTTVHTLYTFGWVAGYMYVCVLSIALDRTTSAYTQECTSPLISDPPPAANLAPHHTSLFPYAHTYIHGCSALVHITACTLSCQHNARLVYDLTGLLITI